jgi:hypothetical protein
VGRRASDGSIAMQNGEALPHVRLELLHAGESGL